MAGTVLKKLSSTHFADNTVVTAANSGFSSVNLGSGNTVVHLDAAKMGANEGFSFTQASTNPSIAYIDLDASINKASFRIPMNFSALPGTFIRAYDNVTHTGNLWGCYFSANKLVFAEGTSGGASATSAGAISLNTNYVVQGFVDSTANTFSVFVSPSGSSSVVASVSGALSTSGANALVQSFRFGIGSSSGTNTGATLYLNDYLAVGSGDFLDRADIAQQPLSLSGTITPASADTGSLRTLTLTASGGTGNAITLDVDWGDGLSHDTGSMTTTATKSFTRTPSSAGSKNAIITYSQT